MRNTTGLLRQVCDANPDAAFIMEKFAEIDHVYRQVLEAMGVTSKPSIEVSNSADTTISLRSTPYSSEN